MSNDVKVVETVKNELVNSITKRGRPRLYDYPAFLTCSITGRKVRTNPTQMKQMVEKSGKDLETFCKEYVCRSARKTKKMATNEIAQAIAKIGTDIV